jgi:hypothetical protein
MKSSHNVPCISPCRRGAKTERLRHDDLLQAIAKGLPRADEQQPIILAFIGNAEKFLAMRTLFGVQNQPRPNAKQKSCEISFQIDPLRAHDDHPLILVNWDVRKSCGKWSGTKRNKCYEAGQSILHQLSLKDVATPDFHTQLLSPFVNIFCYFSADLGGFVEIAHRLARWLEQGNSSTLPDGTLPSVVIIISNFDHNVKNEEESTKAFVTMLREETSEDPFQQLSAINVFALPPKGAVSAKAHFKRVKKHFLQNMERMHKQRQDRYVSFSATHLVAFFKAATAHFTKSTQTPFNFIKASRTFNSISSDMPEHFFNFLKYVTSTQQLKTFAAPMIASSLLLDSYPPDAHG